MKYRSVLDDEREIPAWIDEVLRRATHPDPAKRYQELSEFVYDLRHPSTHFLARTRPPLLERNPGGVLERCVPGAGGGIWSWALLRAIAETRHRKRCLAD